MRRLAGGIAAIGLALAAATGVAGAAGPQEETFELVCDNGENYEVWAWGNGEFTPAHDVDSNIVVVPVEFGVFHGEVRDASGVLVDSFDDPAVSKGQSAKGLKDAVECTFEFSEVSDGSDPEFPAGFTFTGEGSATVRLVADR